MSFLVRRVSVTADGREIVRGTPVDGTEILVGRDAACAVHRADLAVNPQHARLTSSDGRHLEIEAISGLGFEVDGRTTERASIDAGDGAELKFGGHRITVGLDSDSPAPRIALTVTRTDELSHSALDRDEAKAFSLGGKILGRRMSAWLFSLFVLAAFLAAPIWAYMSYRGVEERPVGFHADSSWSSGALSAGHAKLRDDCQSCHVDAFVAVTDTTCASCHEEAHEHAPLSRQVMARGDPGWFQGALNRVAVNFGKPEGRCVDCHTEHEGAGPMPATAQAECTVCHANMSDRLTDTKLGDAGDFGTSHPQFRPAVLVETGETPRFQRMTWTPRLTENNGLKFTHDEHLLGNGSVARMARNLGIGRERGDPGLDCADCHKPTRDGVRFAPVDMERDCQSCHSLTFESVGGVDRTLRHGEPAQVIADLYAYYRSTPPTRPISLGGMARRRPGEFAEGRTYSIYFRETAVRPSRADDAVRAVFSRGGACYDCHTIFAPAAANRNWRVMPVNQTERYLNHGWFDHGPHMDDADEDCSDCHDAKRSTNANQLLIPGIATCRDCHGGEGSDADVASPCASCHEYHAGDDSAAPWRPARDRREQDRDRSRRVTAVTDGGTRRLYGGT